MHLLFCLSEDKNFKTEELQIFIVHNGPYNYPRQLVLRVGILLARQLQSMCFSQCALVNVLQSMCSSQCAPVNMLRTVCSSQCAPVNELQSMCSNQCAPVNDELLIYKVWEPHCERTGHWSTVEVEGRHCQAQVTFITILFLSLNDDDESTKNMNLTKNHRSEKNSNVRLRVV